MPSLENILQDMLVVLANDGKLEGLQALDPTSYTPPKPSPDVSGSKNQSIWYWEKRPSAGGSGDPGYLGQVTHVNCWARAMAEAHNDDDLGWMTVCNSITWSPIKVDVKVGNSPYRLTLPLTEKFVVKTVFLTGGHNPGKGWWPLEADVDSSFFQVFVYDITGKTSSDELDPVPAEVYDHDDFMPDPSAPALEAPTLSPGEQLDLTVMHKQYVCVVMSLVCCKERADFEPGALVGMARLVPHFMVMTNMPLGGLQGSLRIERPELSGYQGTSSEAGRPPMYHHDMDPPIKAIAVADTNLYRSNDVGCFISIPFWDMIFDYVLDAPDGNLIKANEALTVVKDEPTQRTEVGALGLLNYETLSKSVRSMAETIAALVFSPATGGVSLIPMAVGAEAGSVAFARPGIRLVHRDPSTSSAWPSLTSVTDKIYGASGLQKSALLPRKKADVLKLERQGQFDSIHVAPRMKADLLLGRANLSAPEYANTLGEIWMAPFCEHDCFHTHWRWGGNWNAIRMQLLLNNERPISGFSSGGRKFAGVGVPNTKVGAPLVPINQEIVVSFESPHVFNYTAKARKDIVPGVWQAIFHHGSGYAVSIENKHSVLGLVHALTGDILDGIKEPQFSEFYWTLRYQDTVDGPLTRIEVDDATLARLMGL